MTDPQGIVDSAPRLSWQIQTEGRAFSQSAYEVRLALDHRDLDREDKLLWNSGKVISNKSTFISYTGKPFASSTNYYWKVRIWDQKGNLSVWSEPANFETGIIHQNEWKNAQWIGLQEDTRTSPLRIRQVNTIRQKTPLYKESHPSPQLRKTFDVQKKIASARVYISGLGYYELYLNGNRVGDHVLDPANMSFNEYVPYVVYDVSELLQQNKNVVGVWLGNGFYGQNLAFNTPHFQYGKPQLLFLLEIIF